MRIADTVRRTRGKGTHFAAQVLNFLESVGYPYAPRRLGIDERDRDVLTFIPGCPTDHPSQRDVSAYVLSGRMLREFNQLVKANVVPVGTELTGQHKNIT